MGIARHIGHSPRTRSLVGPTNARARPNSQIVGNIGLYYVCYRLSREGWNAMPTARNARGIDLLLYSQDAKRTCAIQVKTLSKRNPVPLGSNLEGLFGDYLVICRNVRLEAPECFVLTPFEAARLAHKGTSPSTGKVSYWLQPKEYEGNAFREAWHRIGSGV